jgi:hypothetical protein
VEKLPNARALALNTMMLHEIFGNLWVWLAPHASAKDAARSQADMS